MLNKALLQIENTLSCDVLCYFGPIMDWNENMMLQIVEDLANDDNKKNAEFNQFPRFSIYLLGYCIPVYYSSLFV